MLIGKKAVIDMHEYWAEFFSFVLLAIGFIVALVAESALISYIVLFLCGMMAGRLMSERYKKIKFPYYLVVIGFLIGYILGSRFGNKLVLLILFIVGAYISHYLHEHGFLKDIAI